MKRALLLALLLLLGAKFAALSIEPYGDQVFDLATGVTTLPQGGVIHDNENDLSIDANYIEYKENEYVLAKEAKTTADKVSFRAASLRYLPAEDSVSLQGGLSLDTAEIKQLSAKSGTLFLKDGVAVLSGDVRAAEPELQAAWLIADYKNGTALLMAPYQFKDESLGVTLRGKNPEKPLFVRFSKDGKKTSASSKAPPQIKERLMQFAEKAAREK